MTIPDAPDPFGSHDWKDSVAAAENVRQCGEQRIFERWSWYERKKQWNAASSEWLNWFALVLSIAGCLVPLIDALFTRRPAWLSFPAAFGTIRLEQLGYVLLALAAGLMLLDRRFGYSAAW